MDEIVKTQISSRLRLRRLKDGIVKTQILHMLSHLLINLILFNTKSRSVKKETPHSTKFVFRAQKTASKWEQRCNEATGQRKFDPRLSFAPTPKNKENFQTPVVNVKESRKSTGSPLARVNRT